MASIATFKKYLDLVDSLYTEVSKTSVLDGNNALVRMGAGAGELIIPKITLDGLSNYNRASGYESGDIGVSYETKKYNYDRGVKFNVDEMDDEETQGFLFARTLGQLESEKVAPEIDAFRIATYASYPGITDVEGDISTGEAVLSALVSATAVMNNASVNTTDRVLFINSDLLLKAKNVDTTKSQAIFDSFMSVVEMPETRFYTAIDLKSKTADSETGYAKASGAKSINFMIVSKSAVIQFTKHEFKKPLSPDNNPDADAWIIRYRKYGIAEVFDNKVKGIYLHHATT